MPVTEQVQKAVRGGGRRRGDVRGQPCALAQRRRRSRRAGQVGGILDPLVGRLEQLGRGARHAAPDPPRDAAASAGEYLAENGPDPIKERIVPAFIEAFEDAK